MLSLSPVLTSLVRPHPLKSSSGISPPLSECSRILSYCFVYEVLSALYCEILTADVDISGTGKNGLCSSCLSGGVQGALPREGGCLGTWVSISSLVVVFLVSLPPFV